MILASVDASRQRLNVSVGIYQADHRMIRATAAMNELKTKSVRSPHPIATPEIRITEKTTSRTNRADGRSRPRTGITNTVNTTKPRNSDRFSCDSHVCAIRTRLSWMAHRLRSLRDKSGRIMVHSLLITTHYRRQTCSLAGGDDSWRRPRALTRGRDRRHCPFSVNTVESPDKRPISG